MKDKLPVNWPNTLNELSYMPTKRLSKNNALDYYKHVKKYIQDP